MPDREIKFRRAHFMDEEHTQFSHFGTWGVNLDEMVFKNPSTNNFAEYFIDSQFTGLKDKNDSPIYEGDILEYSYRRDQHEPPITYTEVVEYEVMSDSVGFGIHVTTSHQVIGNIYESPAPPPAPEGE